MRYLTLAIFLFGPSAFSDSRSIVVSCLNPRQDKFHVLTIQLGKKPGVDLTNYCLRDPQTKKSLGCWNTDKETWIETIPGWVADVVKSRVPILKECKTAIFSNGTKLVKWDIVGPDPLPAGHCIVPHWAEPGERLRWNAPFTVLVPRE